MYLRGKYERVKCGQHSNETNKRNRRLWIDHRNEERIRIVYVNIKAARK